MIWSRTTALTFETCHQPLSYAILVRALENAAQLAVPPLREPDPHVLDRLGGCEAGFADGIGRRRLLDPGLGLGVERHSVPAAGSLRTAPVRHGPILCHRHPRELAPDMGQRLAEARPVGAVVEPAACSGRVGERDRDRVAEQEALADRGAEAADAEQRVRGSEPDRHDERGLEQAQLILAPRGAQRRLGSGGTPVTAATGARAWKAASERGAVEAREEVVLVELEPATQRPSGPPLPRQPGLGLDATGCEPEEIRTLPGVPGEDGARSDRVAGLETPPAAQRCRAEVA